MTQQVQALLYIEVKSRGTKKAFVIARERYKSTRQSSQKFTYKPEHFLEETLKMFQHKMQLMQQHSVAIAFVYGYPHSRKPL